MLHLAGKSPIFQSQVGDLMHIRLTFFKTRFLADTDVAAEGNRQMFANLTRPSHVMQVCYVQVVGMFCPQMTKICFKCLFFPIWIYPLMITGDY